MGHCLFSLRSYLKLSVSQLKYLHFLQVYIEIPGELTQSPSFLHGYVGERGIYSCSLPSDNDCKDMDTWAFSSGLSLAQCLTLENNLVFICGEFLKLPA